MLRLKISGEHLNTFTIYAFRYSSKVRQFIVYTWWLTLSAAEFYCTEIIQIVARQYGENVTEEEINNMDWSQKCNYLKRNPVTVAREIDHIFKNIWGKVILSG